MPKPRKHHGHPYTSSPWVAHQGSYSVGLCIFAVPSSRLEPSLINGEGSAILGALFPPHFGNDFAPSAVLMSYLNVSAPYNTKKARLVAPRGCRLILRLLAGYLIIVAMTCTLTIGTVPVLLLTLRRSKGGAPQGCGWDYRDRHSYMKQSAVRTAIPHGLPEFAC